MRNGSIYSVTIVARQVKELASSVTTNAALEATMSDALFEEA